MPQASLLILATAAAMEVGEGVMQVQAAEGKEKQLDLQAKQNELQYQQKTLSNLDNLNKVIQRQTVQMTTRGVAFSSPSFNAVQRDTENIAARQQKNLDIENKLSNTANIEKRNVRNSLYSQLFGDVASLGLSFAKFNSMSSK